MEKKNANYISLADASALCGRSPDYLNLIARKGYLRAVKIGRNWATKKEWLEDYSSRIEKKHGKKNQIVAEVVAVQNVRSSDEQNFELPVPGNFAGAGNILISPDAPRPFQRSGNVLSASALSMAAVLLAAFAAFAAIFISQKDIFLAGLDAAGIYPAVHDNSGFGRTSELSASLGDAFEGAGRAIAGIWGKVVGFFSSAGSGFIEFVRYVFWGKTEVIEVSETVSTPDNQASGERSGEKGAAIDADLFQDEKETSGILNEEQPLPDDLKQNTDDQGVAVFESTGSAEGDQRIKEMIKESFSDEVEVKISDDSSGVIVPQFRNGAGEDYIYMLVPVNKDQ